MLKITLILTIWGFNGGNSISAKTRIYISSSLEQKKHDLLMFLPSAQSIIEA
ncbi:hypothetical protein RINTHH_6130 [Richelia intracellularis HH01]|uniref:Uncharacterized protein n=1 Tax=Richelia intracellularis HH01 TaxID=1165094 RepID=M1WZG1_9NOST|nr:hypothetical protein RINTHH_6130 [Richelia intracellularis HH01]